MAETLTIRTASSTEIVKIAVPGPQGPKGDKGDPGDVAGLPLTTLGDTLYRGASQNERLAIGSTGQVLKVSAQGLPVWDNESGAVSSVAGRTGAVVLDSTDIMTEHCLSVSDAGEAACNGLYVYAGQFNGRSAFYKDKNTAVYYDGSSWVIANNEDQYFGTSSTHPWQAVWSLGVGTLPLPVVRQESAHEFEQVIGQRTDPTTRGTAATKNVGTGANDVAAGNDARFSDARQPLAHGSTHHTGGTDAIAPNQISAGWALETRSHSFFSTSTYTLAQGRNVQLGVNVSSTNATGTVTLPRLTTDGAQNGDDLFIVASAFSGNTTLIIQRYIWTGSSYLGSTETVVTTTTAGAWRFRLLSGVWTLQPVATHTHPSTQITGLATVATTGDYDDLTDKPTIPTASTTTPSAPGVAAAGTSANFARADHVHSAEVSDSAFRLLGSTDSTKKLAFEVDTNVPSGQTVTLTAPSASGTLALAGAAPSAHAASHASAGSDPLFDQNLNTTDNATFNELTVTNGINAESATLTDLFVAGFEASGTGGNLVRVFGNGLEFVGTSAATTRTNLGLGDSATADIGTSAGEVAAGDHVHGNLTNDGKIGSTAGLPLVTTTAGAVTTLALGTANQVLRVNSGATGVEFADPAASGVTGAASSASDVLGVSGANITGVDANADRIVYWNNTSNKLAYGTPADAGAAAASHTHAASDITSGLAASATTDTTNASNITSGTLGTARLGTGTANNTTFLRGDGTWSAAGVSDGDKGDITVSNSGATWTIDANAVTNADLAQVATATIKGRATASTGNVEDLTASQARGVLALATTDNVTFGSLQGTPIGSTTRSSGAFSSLSSSQGTITASSPVTIAATWNNGAAQFNALDVSISNTDSLSSSTFITLRAGASGLTTMASIMRSGAAFFGQGTVSIGDGTNSIVLYNAGTLSFSSGGGVSANASTGDTILRRDAANTLAMYNTTNAQAFRLYSTFSSTTSFERLNIAAQTGGNFILGTEKGSGGGTARGLELRTDNVARITIGSAGQLGFFGATAAAQPTAVADATDAATVITQLNALLSRMRTLGLIAT